MSPRRCYALIGVAAEICRAALTRHIHRHETLAADRVSVFRLITKNEKSMAMGLRGPLGSRQAKYTDIEAPAANWGCVTPDFGR